MRLTPAIAAFLFVGTAALAQPGPDMGPGPDGQGGPPPQQQGQRPVHATMSQRFDAANTTNDGRLTLEQAQAAHMGKIARNFAQIDADRKGYVTKQDIQAWRHATRQARQQPPGQAAGDAPPPGGQPPQYGQPSPPPEQYAPPQ